MWDDFVVKVLVEYISSAGNSNAITTDRDGFRVNHSIHELSSMSSQVSQDLLTTFILFFSVNAGGVE